MNSKDDIVLSTTCFQDEPLRFAVMYGCTLNQIDQVRSWLKQQKKSVFHHLILPMVFLELERQRVINSFERKSTGLNQKVLDLQNRAHKETYMNQCEGTQNKNMTERDCEAIRLWLELSSLKNGLESLREQLASIRAHLEELSDEQSGSSSGEQDNVNREQRVGIYIKLRLNAMILELQSKIRHCETSLGGMTMATQMVTQYKALRPKLVADQAHRSGITCRDKKQS